MPPLRPLLTILLLSALACEPTPTGPSTAPTTAEARIGNTVVLPMKVRLDLEWVVDRSPDALAACDPRPGLAEGRGEGRATHLGQFEVALLDHCSIDLAAVPPVVDGAGSFEFVAADGSTLYGSYVFLFLPPQDGGFFDLTVEGGTGRLAGANGSLETVFERTGEFVCADPLCLESAKVSGEFSGEIALLRP